MITAWMLYSVAIGCLAAAAALADGEPAVNLDVILRVATKLGLPFLLMFGFLIFIMRQAQGNSNQTLSFGRSKAKLVDEQRPATTFVATTGHWIQTWRLRIGFPGTTAEAESYRSSVVLEYGSSQGPVRIAGEGEFQAEPPRGRLTMNVAQAGSHLPPDLAVDPRNLPPVEAGGGAGATVFVVLGEQHIDEVVRGHCGCWRPPVHQDRLLVREAGIELGHRGRPGEKRDRGGRHEGQRPPRSRAWNRRRDPR